MPSGLEKLKHGLDEKQWGAAGGGRGEQLRGPCTFGCGGRRVWDHWTKGILERNSDYKYAGPYGP